jgi:hypothetical protein
MATSDLLNKLRTDITDTYTSINNLGGTIPEHKNTENISPAIESIYNKLPKVSDIGTDLSLNPTLEARLGLIPRGNTSQDGTPTPTSPIMPKVVTGENSVKVENRNLFDGIKENIYFDNQKRFYGVNGASTTNYIPAKEGDTFTINSKANSNGIVIASFDENYNVIERQAIPTTSVIRPLTYTCPEKTKYIIGSNYVGMSTETQLEKGTTATPYVEHKEQNYPLSLGDIELAEIGNYADYIEGTPDNWVKKEYVGKVVLDGSEAWTYVWQETDRYGYRADIENALSPTSSSQVLEIISNYYKVYSQSTLSHTSASADFTKYGICIRLNNSQIIIKNNDLTSVSDLKEWLSTHNTIIWYPLAEPTDVPITDTTLINQLNALYYARSYDDETNISTSCEDGNMPMKINASALKGI